MMSGTHVPDQDSHALLRQAIVDSLEESLAGYNDIRGALTFLADFTSRLCDRFADSDPSGEIRTLADEFRNSALRNRLTRTQPGDPRFIECRLVNPGVVVITHGTQTNPMSAETLTVNESQAQSTVDQLLRLFPNLRVK